MRFTVRGFLILMFEKTIRISLTLKILLVNILSNDGSRIVPNFGFWPNGALNRSILSLYYEKIYNQKEFSSVQFYDL